jgi:hypothetical protein
MKSNQQEQSGLAAATGASKVLPLSRRAFVTTAASACGTLVLWPLRTSSLYAAEKSGSTDTPSTVTIVEFSPNGKRTGKVTVPAWLSLTPSGGSSSPRFRTKLRVTPEPREPTAGAPGIFTIVDCSGASAVTQRSSAQIQSLIQEPDGLVCGSQSRVKTSLKRTIRARVWSAPRSPVAAAMHI